MIRSSIALALVASAGLACRSTAPAPAPQPPAGEVWITPQQQESSQIQVAKAEDRDVGGELIAAGRIAFDDTRVAHVFSPVSGRVAQVFVQLGQKVKRGQPLVSLEAPDVGSALADLNKAKADLTAANRELKRQRELVAANAGARKDLEAAEDATAKAQAELLRAQQRARLFGGGDGVRQRVTLAAPIDGEVIARAANPGAEVQGQLGGGTAAELVTVGSLDTVWAYADVFEQDLAQVRLGADVKVTPLAYQNKPPLEGRIDYIAAQLDPQTRTARVRCTLKNPDRLLKAEMYATVGISVDRKRALAVPRTAVLRLGDQTVVFVQTGTTENRLVRFERRAVSVADVPGDLLPVERGLRAGEVVVTSGAILLSGMI